jgi:hypothetical protein
MITQQELIELFDYRNGKIFIKHNIGKRSKIGYETGHLGDKGYLRLKIRSKSYLVHRLIFLMHKGYLPEFIDHINGDRADNNIDNLREATRSQNCQNAKLSKVNRSGVKGVSWHKYNQKWYARISLDGKRIDLGYFDSLIEAEATIKATREKLHGVFSNHGGV